jgi:dTDP-glucose 4,6-dehydratase
MRILLTGGAGFIGSNLSDLLIKEGHSVICVDNLITGKKENIQHLFDNPKFEFIEHDVTKYIDIKEKIDYVLHFASPASPIDYLKYPIKTLKVGSLGTHNALGVAKEHKCKFLLASTSEVYGDPLVNPQPETYWGNVNPIGPRGVYDESKRFAEAITLAYHRSHDIDTKIIRIFNTYGPKMRDHDGRAIPNFISQALKGKPLTVYGDGSQTRSFCYVTDLITGIYKLMNSKLNEPVNIGNPNEMKLIDLAKKIIKLTNSKSVIEYKPLPIDDPKVRRPDITKAQKELNWQAKVELEQGLKSTIDWFK